MPKIPVFTSKGTMSTEVGSAQTNIQMSLKDNLATSLAPITKKVSEYGVKRKNAENKTEALELENQAVVELNGYSKEASNMKDGDKANAFLMEKSKLVRTKFESQASNSNVKNIFANNYLMEEQKKVFSVDNQVHKNLMNSRLLASEAKEQSLLTDVLYPSTGDNSLAIQTLPADLTKLYKSDFEDGMINVAEYEAKVANIPNKIAYFTAKKDSVDDPVETFRKLNTGEYEDLNLDTREKLLKSTKMEAAPILKESMENYIVGLELNIDVPINEKAIKEVFNNKVYTDFLETKNNTMRAIETKSSIMNSKIGDEQIYIDGFELNSGNLRQDAEYKEKVKNYASIKEKLIQEDAATLILQNNQIVKDLYDDYNNEQDPEAKDILFKRYVNTVVQAQEDMGINESLIKVIPNKFAKTLVANYQENSPNGKIAYLQQLENQYGSQYGKILNQLTENGLPTTAKFVSYINDEDFAIKAMSIDTDEEKTRLDNFVKDRTDLSDSVISSSVAEGMAELRQVVTYGNKMNTTKANEQLDDMQDIIKYIAINSMSSGTKEKKAIKDAVAYVTKNFMFAGDEKTIGTENTYFIPRNYNNTKLSDGQMKLIKNKASIIKSHYLKDFDMESFQSKNKDITSEELTEEMHGQAEEKGVWVNSADGSGIVFAIPFADGSLGLVQNKNGDFLEIKFDDGSHNLPFSDILLDMKKPLEINVASNRSTGSYKDKPVESKSYRN